jgi:hypothetical protein
MADSSLSTSGDVVSVTIPLAYFERFQFEALFALGAAAQRIQEAARWTEEFRRGERKAEHTPELTVADLDMFDKAARVWIQVDGVEALADQEIRGSRATLRSAAVGCQLDCADSLKDDIEREASDPRPLLDELMFWAGLRDQLAPVEVA